MLSFTKLGFTSATSKASIGLAKKRYVMHLSLLDFLCALNAYYGP
jgi:hypothetical protein